MVRSPVSSSHGTMAKRLVPLFSGCVLRRCAGSCFMGTRSLVRRLPRWPSGSLVCATAWGRLRNGSVSVRSFGSRMGPAMSRMGATLQRWPFKRRGTEAAREGSGGAFRHQLKVDNQWRRHELYSPRRSPVVALRQTETDTRLPTRSTGRKPDAREMHDRVMRRYPKTMARLAE